MADVVLRLTKYLKPLLLGKFISIDGGASAICGIRTFGSSDTDTQG